MSQRVLPECGHSSTQTRWLDDTLPDSLHDHKRQTLKNTLVCKIHSAAERGGEKKVQHILRQAPQSRMCAQVSVCEKGLVFKSHLYSYKHIQRNSVCLGCICTVVQKENNIPSYV